MHSGKSVRKKLVQALTQWQLYLLILPAVVYLLLFCYAPMYGVQIAFKDYRAGLGIWGSQWVGLKHFIAFVNYPNFKQIMMNTVRISVYSFATFPLPVIFALMLNEINNRHLKKTVQMITYAPYFISIVVICSMITLFLGRSSGLINNLIEMMGGERIAFLEKPELFAPIYVWTDVWQQLGFGTIIYLAALSGVSPELVEAARIDGASRIRIIWHINIPAILPTIIIMLIMRCGSILGVGFEKAFLMQNPLNLTTSQVLSTYIYEIGLKSGRYSYSAAIGLFNTVINVTFMIIINKILKRVSEISLW